MGKHWLILLGVVMTGATFGILLLATHKPAAALAGAICTAAAWLLGLAVDR